MRLYTLGSRSKAWRTLKIIAVEAYWTRIPFIGGKPAVMGGLNWQSMNSVWLQILMDQELEG
jgi:hypothetical protein